MDRVAILRAILVVAVVGGVFYGLISPWLSGEMKGEKRKKALQKGAAVERKAGFRSGDPTQRRKQVTDSLKEIEARGRRKKLTLEAKLTQAGLAITKARYFVFCGASAAILAFFLLIFSGSFIYAGLGAFIGGFGAPKWLLSFLRKRRINKFINEFPNAVDVIVRGIKAGLPLGDCLRVIASEAAEPVKSEFRQIVEHQTIGLSVSEAVEKISERVPVPEANFFAIVISIQQKAGGNLSEALGNLSRVLRDRKKMKAKIKAMSSEAKASAGIIGSLPFVVTGLVYLSSPAYITLLWTTSIGCVVLGACAVWMFVGVMVMRKMVSFDI
jgi:tight adherence protein B